MHWKRVQRGAPLTGVDDARYALVDAALDEALEPALVDLLKADAVLRAIPSDVTQDPAFAAAVRQLAQAALQFAKASGWSPPQDVQGDVQRHPASVAGDRRKHG
jgi:hypothetical protein